MSTFSKASLLSPFTHRAGLSLATASNVAYANASAVRTEVAGWEMDLPVEPFDKNHTQGFFASDDELLILSFRGTERNFGDWLTNLRLAPTDHDMGRVHCGFSQGLDQVWDETVLPTLRRFGPGRKIWLTGHSLGAALATLTAARVALQIPEIKIEGIATFGQPRLASRDFRERFNSAYAGRFHRYVNDRDIVPRIPPGYRHVERLIHFDQNGHVIDAARANLEAFGSASSQRELTELEYERFMAAAKLLANLGSAQDPDTPATKLQLEGLIPGLDLFEGIRDHSLVKGYIPALIKAVESSKP